MILVWIDRDACTTATLPPPPKQQPYVECCSYGGRALSISQTKAGPAFTARRARAKVEQRSCLYRRFFLNQVSSGISSPVILAGRSGRESHEPARTGRRLRTADVSKDIVNLPPAGVEITMCRWSCCTGTCSVDFELTEIIAYGELLKRGRDLVNTNFRSSWYL